MNNFKLRQELYRINSDLEELGREYLRQPTEELDQQIAQLTLERQRLEQAVSDLNWTSCQTRAERPSGEKLTAEDQNNQCCQSKA